MIEAEVGTSAFDGGCNGCGKNSHTCGVFHVLVINLNSCSIRLCWDCAVEMKKKTKFFVFDTKYRGKAEK